MGRIYSIFVKRFVRQAFFCVIFLLSASVAHADLLSDVKARGKLTCGTMDTIEPLGYIDPSTRKVVGFDVDICEGIAKGLGVAFEQKSLSIAQRIPELTLGRVDILSAVMGWTLERSKIVDYSDSHFQVPISIIVKSDSPYKKIEDLKGKRVGMTSGSTPEYWLRRRFPDIQSITYKDTPSVFVALQQGKIQGEGITRTSGARLASFGNGEFRFLEENLGYEADALVVRKNEPAFLAAVNKILQQMESSGEIDRIWNKWLGKNTEYNIVRDKKLTPISEVTAEFQK